MFDNIDIVLNGQTMTIVDFSWLNSILPTVHLWSEGIFWLFYVFYLVNQAYFLIRGVPLFNTSQSTSGLTVTNGYTDGSYTHMETHRR